MIIACTSTEPRGVLKMMKRGGFTLVELILVVLVVLILSFIAIPNYSKSKQKVIEKEGIANVKLLAAAERIYMLEQGWYAPCSCNSQADCISATGCNPLLKLMLNSTNVTYASNAGGTITATGPTGCVYTLLPAGYDGEPTKTGTCP